MINSIAIVGAGVIGATTALKLAELGFQVHIFEANPKLCMGASGANGAQLSYNYSDALASPQILSKLPNLVAGLDASFRLNARIDLDFVKWGLEFLRNCSSKMSDRNTIENLALALESKIQMDEWNLNYDFDYNFREAQKLHLYDSQRELDLAKSRVDLKNRHGGNQTILSRTQILELEPCIEQANLSLVGGIHSPNDAVGDLEQFIPQAIKKALSLSNGELHLGTEVKALYANSTKQTIETNNGSIQVDATILCTGSSSTKITRKFKPPIVMPVHGYSLTLPANNSTPTISLTDVSKKMVLCRLGEQLRVAGMADIGLRKNPKARVEQLERLLRNRFPKAADYSQAVSTWSGARPMTASSKPAIRESCVRNVYLNLGHGMLGWTLAAGSASRITNLIRQRFN